MGDLDDQFNFDDEFNWDDLFGDLGNATDDPSTVVDELRLHCPKVEVNQFGARFIPVFYYTTFLLSYLGNGLVLFIICKFEKLSKMTNIFLLNLVVSNLLFASSLPFWATYHSSQWVFGPVLCKLVSSVYFIGFYSSVLFLSLMTLDQYLAVVHAVEAFKSRTRTCAVCASLAVWAISILASVKELALQNVREDPALGLLCEETGSQEVLDRWNQVVYYQQFLLFFLLPLCLLMFCYISITVRIMSTRMKEKCRSIKLIFIIVFTYFACWTPYNTVILLQAIRISSGASNSSTASCSESDALDLSLYVTRNVAYLYCCISPVFYTFMGKKFQSHFRRLLAKKFPCLRRHISLTSQSSRTTSQKTPQTTYDLVKTPNTTCDL